MSDQASPSLKDTQEAIRILFEPGQVVELRALGGRGTTSGYYSNHDALALDAIKLSGKPTYDGIFWTLQQINPDLLARSNNKYAEWSKLTTSDPDVRSFRWLLIDCDPVRPAGISSHEAEKAAALKVAQAVVLYFREEFRYEAFVGDSGNGYHVYVRVNLPTADKDLVKRVLESLAAKFSTDRVKIDRSVFNPARISKCYGSVARKGDSTADRPHRLAKMVKTDGTTEPLSREVLEQIAGAPQVTKASAPENPSTAPSPEKIEEFLAAAGIEHGGRKPWKNGFKWELSHCPFDESHTATSVVVTATDTYGFSCEHNSCADYHWAEFRKHVEEKIGYKFAFAEKTDEIKERERKHAEALARIDAVLMGSEPLDIEAGMKVMRDMTLLTVGEREARRKRLAQRLGWRTGKLDEQIADYEKEMKAAGTDQKFDAVAATVEQVRQKLSGLLDYDPQEADKKVAETIVWEWLRAHSKVFCCYGIGYLLLNDGDGVPMEVSQDDKKFDGLLMDFGVNPGAPTRLRIGKYIGARCYQEGTHTETHLAFHYDPKTFTAYIAGRRGVLIKLNRWGFDEVPNGTDGVLFVFPNNWQPLLPKPLDETGHDLDAPTVVEKDQDGKIIKMTGDFPKSYRVKRALFADGFLVRHLFNGINFDIKGLSEKQLRILLLAYLLFLMLPGAVSERVLLELLGPSGSGKTFFGVLLGYILFGENFKSQPLPSEPKEFENQVINSYFLVYDNVSFIPHNIRDLICQAVTGMDVVRRILYTDKEEMRVPSMATLALSAKTPPLPELEHQNRSITTHFKERPEGTYVSQIELRNQVLAERDEIIINLLYRLTLTIDALEAEKDYVPRVNNRLASVATFILRIAKHEGWEDEAKRLLDAWSGDQVAGSLSEDDVSEAIARWMSMPKTVWTPILPAEAKDEEQPKVFPSEWMTATALNEKLIEATVASLDDSVLRQTQVKNLSWGSSPVKLANKLAGNLKVYASRFGLERDESKFRNSRGSFSYRFAPSASQLAEAKELARGVLSEIAF